MPNEPRSSIIATTIVGQYAALPGTALSVRIVAEHGPPVGKPGMVSLAGELGIDWRTLYDDMAALDRDLVEGGDAPSD